MGTVGGSHPGRRGKGNDVVLEPQMHHVAEEGVVHTGVPMLQVKVASWVIRPSGGSPIPELQGAQPGIDT